MGIVTVLYLMGSLTIKGADCTVYSLVSCPDRRSSPSLRRSGDPSPKGRFNGRDMGRVMSGLIACFKCCIKAYYDLYKDPFSVFVYMEKVNLD